MGCDAHVSVVAARGDDWPLYSGSLALSVALPCWTDIL